MVGNFFLQLGLPTSVNGYHYAKEGVAYVIENKCSCTKTLYLHISRRFNANVANIERCIRTLIDKSFNKLKESGIFFARPTNREFIVKCAELVNLQMNNTVNDFEDISVYDIVFR